MTARLVLVESNTTGTGRMFAQQASSLDVEPVLITADPERYRYVREDRLAYVLTDTADPAAVLEAVRGLPRCGPIVGVTSSSEYYIATAATVAGRLGLPGPRAAAVSACRDKSAQRRALAAAGVPVPAFAVARDPDAVAVAVAEIGLPVVVKPLQGSGSTGVRWCPSAGAAARHAAPLLAAASNERGLAGPPGVLVEQYLTGPEYSVEVFGDRVVAIVAKHLGPRPTFVEIGHDVPAPLPGADRVLLERCALDAVRALGLGFGAAHVEIRLEAGRPYLVEVNPRLAGGMIPQLVRRATGADLVRAQVLVALGRPVDLTATARRSASIRFLTASGPGTLLPSAGPVAGALATPGVTDVELYGDPYRRVGPAVDFRGRLGHVISVADEPAGARHGARDGLRQLREAIRYDAADRRPQLVGGPS